MYALIVVLEIISVLFFFWACTHLFANTKDMPPWKYIGLYFLYATPMSVGGMYLGGVFN